MADATIDSVSIEFEGNVDKLNSSLNNLITILDKLKASTSGSIGGLKKVSDATKNLEKNTKSLGKTNKDVNKVTTSLVKLGTKVALLKVLSNGIYKTTKASAELISTQTVFNSVFSSMDKMQEASQFVEDYTQKLYADEKVVKSAMSTFAQLTKNMGVNNEVSYIMSKNLTQLGYDLAATGIAGTDVNEAFTALKSGIGGEAEALKRYGVMLNQNTLQQTLYTNGINKKVSELNSAQKAELLYYQIIQSTTAQQGYAAQAMMQPANAIQILKTQFTSLTRAIGNLFIPILMKLLPYLIAATQMLQSLAQSIANFFNIKIDFSNSISTGIDNIQTGIDGIGDSADSTKKKVQNMLRDFDELHVINFDTDTSSGSGTGIGGGGSLGLPLQDYDAFSKMTNEFSDRIEKAKNSILKLKDYIIEIGLAIATWKIISAIEGFSNLVKKATELNSILKKIGITLIVSGLYLSFSGISDQLKLGSNFENMLKSALGSLAVGIGATLLAHSKGTDWKMAITIGVSVGLALEALSIGISIGDWIGEKLGINQVNINDYIEKWNFTPDTATLGEKINFSVGVIWDLFDKSLQKNFGITGKQFAKTLGILLVTSLIAGIVIAIAGVPVAIASLFAIAIAALALGFGLVLNELGVIWQGIKKWGSDRLQNIKDFCSWIQNVIVDFFVDVIKYISTVPEKIGNKIEEIKNKVSNKFDEIVSKISEKIENAKETIRKGIEIIKNFFNFEWSFPAIKLPHFEWTSQPAKGWMADVLSKFNLPTSLPKLNVSWYATGGFPKKGELFVANENAPEMIGKMGNKNVVANNRQITAGISEGVYNAVYDAMSNFGGNGDTYVYVGTKQITDVITKKQKSDNDKYGR